MFEKLGVIADIHGNALALEAYGATPSAAVSDGSRISATALWPSWTLFSLRIAVQPRTCVRI